MNPKTDAIWAKRAASGAALRVVASTRRAPCSDPPFVLLVLALAFAVCVSCAARQDDAVTVSVRGIQARVSLPDHDASAASGAHHGVASAAGEPPLERDRDGDGVRDDDDQCPDHWEDCDGFDDRDGCPDLDNDGDRILDACDRCPNEPETYNGFEDEDGCPDRGNIIVQSTSIQILSMVQFPARNARPMPASIQIIDAIANTMIGNPQIERIAIVGHASPDEPNAQRLSEDRANAIVELLVQRGVARARMESHGSAAAFPLAPNNTEVNRARNRRVAFSVLRIYGVTERQWQGNQVVDVPRAPNVIGPSAGAAGNTQPRRTPQPLPPHCLSGSLSAIPRPPPGGCPR